MSVLGRVLISSAERVDLPDLLSVDSYNAGDFKYLLKGLVGDARPYVLKGFDVIDPQNAIGTQSCAIRVAESVVFYPGSSAGPFFHGLPEGHTEAQPLVPELRKNAVNYVYLTLSTFNTASDTRAFWDPDKDGGAGGEYTQDINTESALKCEINVSVGSFPSNVIPIAKITVGAVVISAIEDARDMMFRLGTGGISPDPYSNYSFKSLPGSGFKRAEPPTKMLAGGDNPFQGADKNIYSLKEWMDVVMTKLKELGGTTFWYQDTSTFGLISSFVDSIATSFKSKGHWLHDSSTPGLVTWSEDINFKIATDLRTYTLRAGNATLSDEEVAYLPMVRNQPINSLDQVVGWTNGANYVNTVGGAIGLFANLAKGDWVKAVNDANHLFLQVEEFYDSVNLGGSVTTAANAKSIRLNGNYDGPTLNEKGRYDKGFYLSTDVVVSTRDQAAITSAGGNFNWLFLRSDTIQKVSNIATTTLTIDISNHDGSKARVVASGAHGLVDGDRVTISGSTNFNGTYIVEVESSTGFNISKIGAIQPNESGVTARYATITTTTRSTAYGLQLESANHGFSTNDTVIISSTANYNGAYQINKRSATSFTIPVNPSSPVETSGLATLAKITVRSEQGISNVVQGETADISDGSANAIKTFLGMSSDSEQYPNYAVPDSYNTLKSVHNFNSSINDNVTTRLSKLTAMMADRVQDRNIIFAPSGLHVVKNITNGAAQELTFLPSGASLTIIQTGAPGNATLPLPNLAPGISLLANEVAYIVIDRNAATAPSIQITSVDDEALIAENVLIIAARLSGVECWMWNGKALTLGGNSLDGGTGFQKVRLHDPVSTSLPIGIGLVVDGVTVNADDFVLFSNLTTGDNKVYQAMGTGTNISSWDPQLLWGGSDIPGDGDAVIVQEGNSFADCIGKFNGTEWVFNDKVRYFNGADYWEQSNINTSTLADNTAIDNVFTVNYAGSENIIVEYSLLRGTQQEIGTIHMTTDGSNVAVTTTGAYIGASGITFSGDISGSLVRLRYSSTATGDNATMKYMLRRWSSSAGGPGGPPSYTGGGGGGGTPGGTSGDIQFNSAGSFAGNSNFKIDTAESSINLNGLKIQALSSTQTIIDNTVSPTSLFTYTASGNNFAVIEYSIQRGSAYRVGRLMVAHDGSTASLSDDYVETAAVGVTFSAVISGLNVAIQYISTNTGSNGSLKYSTRRWS